MAEIWSKGEYRLTNAVYEAAVALRKEGRPAPRHDIVARCKRDTGRRAEGSVLAQLGALSAARKALGMEVLPEFPPLAHYPRKLFAYLQAR